VLVVIYWDIHEVRHAMPRHAARVLLTIQLAQVAPHDPSDVTLAHHEFLTDLALFFGDVLLFKHIVSKWKALRCVTMVGCS
jgi:hypothetical protein